MSVGCTGRVGRGPRRLSGRPGGRLGRRRAAVLLGLVAALLGAGALAPGVARAGGPTSVLLVSPQADRAAALHHTDAAYGRLHELLAAGPLTAAPPPADGAAGSTAYVTVTWLVHDVSIWRIDRVLLDATGGPWVVTSTADAEGAVATDLYPGGPGASWHRPTNPTALLALLGDLGLTGQRSAGSGAVGSPAADPAVNPALRPAEGAAAAQGASGAGAGGDGAWWWAGAGGLLGAAAAVLGLRASPGLRRRMLSAGPIAVR